MQRSRGSRWAVAAGVVGLGYAGVSAYWGLGGTALLDTVGGAFADAAGSSALVVVVWAAVLAKLVAVVVPVLAVRNSRRAVHVLAWCEATVLIGYGLVLTTAGLLVQAGMLPAAPNADQRALAWHAYLWDPWFLLWGLLVAAALIRAGQGRRARTSLGRCSPIPPSARS